MGGRKRELHSLISERPKEVSDEFVTLLHQLTNFPEPFVAVAVVSLSFASTNTKAPSIMATSVLNHHFIIIFHPMSAIGEGSMFEPCEGGVLNAVQRFDIVLARLLVVFFTRWRPPSNV